MKKIINIAIFCAFAPNLIKLRRVGVLFPDPLNRLPDVTYSYCKNF